MPVPLIIAIIITAWLAVASLVAIAIGRTADVGEHERTLDALHREARHADAAKQSADGPTARGSAIGVSTRPRS